MLNIRNKIGSGCDDNIDILHRVRLINKLKEKKS